jgi:hypothetical protein
LVPQRKLIANAPQNAGKRRKTPENAANTLVVIANLLQNATKHRKTPENAGKRRKTPENAGKRRKMPENAGKRRKTPQISRTGDKSSREQIFGGAKKTPPPFQVC